jgi:hypothetical protein
LAPLIEACWKQDHTTRPAFGGDGGVAAQCALVEEAASERQTHLGASQAAGELDAVGRRERLAEEELERLKARLESFTKVLEAEQAEKRELEAVRAEELRLTASVMSTLSSLHEEIEGLRVAKASAEAEAEAARQQVHATLSQLSEDAAALQPPAWWDAADATDSQSGRLVRLGVGRERDDAIAPFMRTMDPHKTQVKCVYRVQNTPMWRAYALMRERILVREGTKDIGRLERGSLFHGTRREALHKIVKGGFNRSFSMNPKNASMHGKGVYFARDSSYSARHQYAQPDANGVQYVFLCRVIVGVYCRGRQNAITPDARPGNPSLLCDSTVGLHDTDSMANPSIYVTYHDDQAYPEYVVCFTQS